MAQEPLRTNKLTSTIVVPTAYGPMLVNRHDINQTNALFKTGLAIDHDGITLLRQLLTFFPPNRVFLDVGACMGTYSIALAPIVGDKGEVHSFEPQRLIYYLLAGSVALNGFSQVYAHNMAVGDHEGEVEIPQFDYNQPMNFGSVEFGPEQREKVEQERRHNPAEVKFIPLTTLDRFNFPRVDLIKIDVEGMEINVLEGAKTTLRRCRPILYVERIKSNSDRLFKTIEEQGYTVYHSRMDFLAIPTEKRDAFPLQFVPAANG